jgi:hypothetical protein
MPNYALEKLKRQCVTPLRKQVLPRDFGIIVLKIPVRVA